MPWVGVDVGGTFTDVAVYDEASGALSFEKSPTNPVDPTAGLLHALARLAVDLGATRRIVHGTTVPIDTEERMRLEGKVALISGGARGMGAEEGRLFAKEGAKVVLGDVLEAEGKAVEEQIRAAGGEATFVRLDVTSEADWEGAVATAERLYGRLDILVNNAGIGGGNRIEDTTLAQWERTMAVNATGVFLGTRAVIVAMRRAGGGSIVNISSQLGLVGTDNSSPQYQASKGAVRLLTKATAIQYAKEGIRANSVHPGPVVTAMTERRRADPEQHRLMVSRIPLGRYGQPLEVALGVLYLASDEASFVTGSELVIDGGWTAQ